MKPYRVVLATLLAGLLVTVRTAEESTGAIPNALAIDRCDSPASHRSDNSTRSPTDNRPMTHLHTETPSHQGVATIT
jgi:hypothetical protein